MNIRFVLPFLVIAIIAYSCKKSDTTTETRDTNFYITALKDNAAWSGNPLVLPLGDTLDIRGGSASEVLRMKIKFTTVGKYYLTGTQSEFVQTNGAAVLSRYKVRTDTISSVTITSYNANTRIFEGEFELKLVQYYPVSVNPLKLSFTTGKLRTVKAILID